MDLFWSVLCGVSGGVGITALYHGLAVGRMGVVAPVTGVLAALIPVVAGIVLEGVPSALTLVGIVLAIVAVVLVSRVERRVERPVAAFASRWSPASGSVCSACSSRRSATGMCSGRWPSSALVEAVADRGRRRS